MADPAKTSLNTATVREQWTLAQCIEGCARHGFAGISPWRDKLAEMGVERAARQIRDAGLRVTGLCRGGMYPAANEAGRAAALDDNRRAVDVYHVWWDPELSAQIARAGRDRLFAFHVCDWLVPTRDLLLDRGMMGDGVIDIPAIRDEVENAGYDGLYEVEIFSAENWWKRDPDEVMRIILERVEAAV